jgi:ABC-type uncharacterized transport system substrate-binding protein
MSACGTKRTYSATYFQCRLRWIVGDLFSYGGNLPDQFKYAASYVDRILKGAKPADLPVEQPIQFDFAVNLKTAKMTLGLTSAIAPRRSQ